LTKAIKLKLKMKLNPPVHTYPRGKTGRKTEIITANRNREMESSRLSNPILAASSVKGVP